MSVQCAYTAFGSAQFVEEATAKDMPGDQHVSLLHLDSRDSYMQGLSVSIAFQLHFYGTKGGLRK